MQVSDHRKHREGINNRIFQGDIFLHKNSSAKKI